MSFVTMILVVSLLGAAIGVKYPWLGGIPGLLMTPLLFYSDISFDMIPLIIRILILFIFGLAYGFISSIAFSGLKGRGQRVGQSFISGFGAHHPGGIILSDEDFRILRGNDIKREVIFLY